MRNVNDEVRLKELRGEPTYDTLMTLHDLTVLAILNGQRKPDNGNGYRDMHNRYLFSGNYSLKLQECFYQQRKRSEPGLERLAIKLYDKPAESVPDTETMDYLLGIRVFNRGTIEYSAPIDSDQGRAIQQTENAFWNIYFDKVSAQAPFGNFSQPELTKSVEQFVQQASLWFFTRYNPEHQLPALQRIPVQKARTRL
ncbi:MAG TPA: hypothetical protein VGT05_03885 [Patescibacteria group bacterium]|nr:hypothetical protein [Patescibacteria group bacterium]